MATPRNAASYMILYIYLNSLINEKNLVVINNIEEYAKSLATSLRKRAYRQFII